MTEVTIRVTYCRRCNSLECDNVAHVITGDWSSFDLTEDQREELQELIEEHDFLAFE